MLAFLLGYFRQFLQGICGFERHSAEIGEIMSFLFICGKGQSETKSYHDFSLVEAWPCGRHFLVKGATAANLQSI